jgi:hypothetical protein
MNQPNFKSVCIHSPTIGRKQEVCGVLALAPLDLVDLLLNLKRFEIVELRLVRLKFGVEFVLAPLLLQSDARQRPSTTV